MKKRITTGAAAALLLLVAACSMTGTDPEQAAPPEGKAAVRIGIEAAGIQSRTVLPAAAPGDVTGWKLWGAKSSETETLLAEFPGATTTVYLEAETWDFTLKGYKDNNLILQGTITGQSITLEGSNTLSFTVAPLEEGAGSVKITISLPEGHGINTVKVFKDGTELSPELAPNNNRIVYEASPDAGNYYYSFRLYKGSDLYGVVSEVAQVRLNLASEKTYTLGREDLNLVYGVNYGLNGGQFGSAPPDSYRSVDRTIALPSPTRAGYTFAGWHGDAGFGGSAVAEIPQGSAGDKNFYAKWTAISYAIAYELNGGTNNAANPVVYTIETPDITLANPARAGYSFGGWHSDAAFSGAVTEIPMGSTEDKTFYAKWTAISYAIAYELNGGTNDAANPVVYTIETPDITLANPARAGYSFGGWHSDAEFSGAVTEIPAGSMGNKTFYAKWTAISYAIAYELNGGINAGTNPETYTIESEDITLDNPARAGYAFGGWHSDAEFSVGAAGIPAGSMGDKTFYARWQHEAAINISVWINEDGNILVSNNDITISKGLYVGSPNAFSARVWETYANIQWELNGAPIGGAAGTARDITIHAANYDNGTYILGVTVTRNGIPYSTDLRFTVTD